MLEHRNVCAGIGEGNVVEGKGVLTVVTFFDRECDVVRHGWLCDEILIRRKIRIDIVKL